MTNLQPAVRSGIAPRAMAIAGTLLTFAAAVLLIVEGRAFTWLAPPIDDPRLYAYIGNAWLHGDLPYRHAWEMKPPGIFAVNAAVFKFFPYSFHALAVVEGLGFFGCAITLYLLLREWQVSRTGRCLAVVVFVIASGLVVFAANLAELYLFWPAALSMLFFARALPDLRARWVLLSGFFAGLGSLFKITGLDPLVAQSAYLFLLWLVYRRWSLPKTISTIAMAFAGAALAWLPFFGYFAIHGALRDLIDVSFIDPFLFASAIPKSLGRYAGLAYLFLADLYPLVVFILIGFVAYLATLWFSFSEMQDEDGGRLRVRLVYILAALWAVIDLAGGLTGNRSHPQYGLPLTLSLAALAGVTFTNQVETKVPSSQGRFIVLALLLAPLLMTNVNKELREVVHLARYGHELTQDQQEGHDQPSMDQRLRQVTAFIDSRRSTGDTLFSWDLQPWAFQMLDIKSSIYVLDLGFRNQLPGHARQTYVEGILNQLQASPPTFIMDTTKDPELARTTDPFYDTFEQFVDRHYRCLNEFRLNADFRIRVYKAQGSEGVRIDPGVSRTCG